MSSLQRLKTSNPEVYSVTLVSLSGEEFVVQFRGPSRSELTSAKSLSGGNKYTYYEELIKKCIVSPKILFDKDENTSREGYLNSELFRAGEIYYLGIEIEKASALEDSHYQAKLSSEADLYLNSDQGRLDCLALAVMPGLNLFDLLDASPENLFKVWKVAETLAAANGIDIRIFLDPEAYLKDMKKQEQEILLQQKLAQAESELDASQNRRQKKRQRMQSNSVSL